MIKRDLYLNQLINWKDKQIIKVITGIRRCGKSYLLKLFISYLKENNVDDSQIISINFEDPQFDHLTNYKSLYDYINEKLIPNKRNYIFLDEIQNVEQFEKAVDGLFIKDNLDLYITGSNAYFMSSELATLLSGRYIEIQMLPLSFKEFVSTFEDKSDLATKYRMYLENGSFPYTLNLNNDRQLINQYLEGIYNTVILKDIVTRKNVSDASILNSVIEFMFDNVGNITSPKKISDTLTSKGRKTSNHTVENYLSALVDSFLLYKATRYDIKGKQYLTTNHKYYLVDIGLRYFLLGSKQVDLGHILENIVYLELIRRGYKVYVGKTNKYEIDFVAQKANDIEYYQVAQTVVDNETLNRELKPLQSINDNYPKYILTMDNVPNVSYNGINQKYVLDWLLE